ncbi:polyprenyl synthetase family protein [Promicromonospora thailandica]|uniref:Geranylgeranyl diphosphate synthase, type II n=1 Tax=Promicromonospora thailandica TaxID=765201 RepID=A0A9X2G8C3_9MICO|nr:polyprenyl synthetase family protein [Promicromonospora thailandica]MCP2267448.1 geranylgeranyl diphosphate synthase, type II [Promicromonospora thailandica]BFF21296.1 polyprenyl synthetase family protein [Promicromonospora thailandica]
MTETLARDAVDVVLSELFEDRIRRAAASADHYALLWRRLARSIEGGKRLRPRLLLDAHRAFGDPHPEDATLAAAAFELLHTALLLHDDVIDRDLSRRGRPNLTGEFAQDARAAGLPRRAATAWGEASGVLGGDLLLSATYTLLARVRSDAHGQLVELVDECLYRAAAGEHADVAFGLGTAPASPERLLRMMEDKTGGYSFAAPLRAGAALAGAGPDAAADLERVGTALGVLYQLRDDVLGVFGDPARTGKSTTGDLREGKRTLLVAFAEGHPAWTAVRHLWGAPDLDDDDAGALRAALVASGALDAMVETIGTRRREVSALIERTTLPPALRAHLTDLARRLTERES